MLYIIPLQLFKRCVIFDNSAQPSTESWAKGGDFNRH